MASHSLEAVRSVDRLTTRVQSKLAGITDRLVLLAGLDCNLVQVKCGLAWHYKQYQREQSPTDQQSYAAAEIEARAAKLGLWRDADPMLPWEFRRKGKQEFVTQ